MSERKGYREKEPKGELQIVHFWKKTPRNTFWCTQLDPRWDEGSKIPSAYTRLSAWLENTFQSENASVSTGRLNSFPKASVHFSAMKVVKIHVSNNLASEINRMMFITHQNHSIIIRENWLPVLRVREVPRSARGQRNDQHCSKLKTRPSRKYSVPSTSASTSTVQTVFLITRQLTIAVGRSWL